MTQRSALYREQESVCAFRFPVSHLPTCRYSTLLFNQRYGYGFFLSRSGNDDHAD